ASLLKRLSIQYVYERVFFCLRLYLKAGAKLKLLFVSRKKNLRFFLKLFFRLIFSFFSPVCQGTFRVLRGANVKSFFLSRKLF
ncbi:hypothetical protein, partial [Flavobacterium nitrogenifigens]